MSLHLFVSNFFWLYESMKFQSWLMANLNLFLCENKFTLNLSFGIDLILKKTILLDPGFNKFYSNLKTQVSSQSGPKVERELVSESLLP